MDDRTKIAAIAGKLLPFIEAVQEFASDQDTMDFLRQLVHESAASSIATTPTSPTSSVAGGAAPATSLMPPRRRAKRNPNPCGYCSHYKSKCVLLLPGKTLCVKCRDLGLPKCVPKKSATDLEPELFMDQNKEEGATHNQISHTIPENFSALDMTIDHHTGDHNRSMSLPSTLSQYPAASMSSTPMQASDVPMHQSPAYGNIGLHSPNAHGNYQWLISQSDESTQSYQQYPCPMPVTAPIQGHSSSARLRLSPSWPYPSSAERSSYIPPDFGNKNAPC